MLACTPPTSTLKGSIEPCPLATSSSPGREGRPASSTTRSAGSSRPAGGIPGPFAPFTPDTSASRASSRKNCSTSQPHPRRRVALLRTSPAAGGIGTCRYKLKKGQDLDFERVVEVLRAHDIGYFFDIGGNDSQDTAHKLSKLAHERGLDLVATGVPKTIDNDLGDPEFSLLDHSPGYGSVARYYAHYIRQANEENSGLGAGRPRTCHPGHGPEDRLHPGGGTSGRSRARRCRCRST